MWLDPLFVLICIISAWNPPGLSGCHSPFILMLINPYVSRGFSVIFKNEEDPQLAGTKVGI